MVLLAFMAVSDGIETLATAYAARYHPEVLLDSEREQQKDSQERDEKSKK